MKVFFKHINTLSVYGFKDYLSVFKSQGIRFLEGNYVVITFDDGYKGVLNDAFPAMERHGFKGIVFVVTGYLGFKSNWDVPFLSPLQHLDSKEIKFLSDNGWLVGSHSHTHKDLTSISYQELMNEVITSKKILEDITGSEISLFSYPFGKYNRKVQDALLEAGYKYAFKSSAFYLDFSNPMAIPRRSIYLSDFDLGLKIDPFYRYIEIFKETISNSLAYLSPIYLKLLKSTNSKPGYDQ
ncbi:MAG: polysaccharide deacetylase family protein [Candidatus Hydrothermia bacterium]